MKALTIHQPYAGYIINGVKQYETRHWKTSYRGLLAIHAGKAWTQDLHDETEAYSNKYDDLRGDWQGDSPPLGVVLGIAVVDAVTPGEQLITRISDKERLVGNFQAGRYGWKMRVIEKFDIPIQARGAQSLWDWDIPNYVKANRVAIVGSRDYADLDAVRDYVRQLPDGTTVISGGVRGVDSVAEETARDCGLRVVSLPVDTTGLSGNAEDRRRDYGIRAMTRNTWILQLSGRVVAFWDGSSRGTQDSITKAKKLGMPVEVNPQVAKQETILVQKQFDFLSTYDESAYIEASNADADPSADVPIYEWAKPWLIDDLHVWVFDGWNGGKRSYRPAKKDSRDATKLSRLLGGMAYSSETTMLRDWLDTKVGYVDTPNYSQQWDVDELPREYVFNRHYNAEIRTVYLEDIQPTQHDIKLCQVRHYIRTRSQHDVDGNLPFAIQFTDTKVLLLNGHHRYAARWWSSRESMLVNVESIPMTLMQASGLLPSEIDRSDSELMEICADVLQEAMKIIQGDGAYAEAI